MAGTGIRLGQGSEETLGAEPSDTTTTTASTSSWITFSSVWMPVCSPREAKIQHKIKTLDPEFSAKVSKISVLGHLVKSMLIETNVVLMLGLHNSLGRKLNFDCFNK